MCREVLGGAELARLDIDGGRSLGLGNTAGHGQRSIVQGGCGRQVDAGGEHLRAVEVDRRLAALGLCGHNSDAAFLLNNASRNRQAIGIHHVAEVRRRSHETRTAVNRATHVDGARAQHDAVDRVHAPLDGDGAVGIQRGSTAEQLLHRVGVGAIGTEETLHKGRSGRAHVERAHVHHTTCTHHQAVGVGKPDIATNTSVLDTVEHPVDVCARVAHDIDQIGGTRRHMQVGRVACVHAESAERVEGVVATERGGCDVDGAGGRQVELGRGPAVGCNSVQRARHGGRHHTGCRAKRRCQQCRQTLATSAPLAAALGVLGHRHPHAQCVVPDNTVNAVH